jgi:hypothetical protein
MFCNFTLTKQVSDQSAANGYQKEGGRKEVGSEWVGGWARCYETERRNLVGDEQVTEHFNRTLRSSRCHREYSDIYGLPVLSADWTL